MTAKTIKKTLVLLLAISVFGLSSPAITYAEEAMTESGIKVQTGFSDVPRTSQYYTAVTYLSDEGIISGYPDGTFLPSRVVNRAEAIKIILSGAQIEAASNNLESSFSDVPNEAWFKNFVMAAAEKGIVNGNPDGTFAPERQVTKAGFIKMLLVANGIDVSGLNEAISPYPDVPDGAWFAAPMIYAGTIGIVPGINAEGHLGPGNPLTRGEVAEIMYLMSVIRNGNNTQFLLLRAESEMAQIEVYVAANEVALAKKASELAVDLTQQAYKNLPENQVVLGAAKLARAYDWLVDSFILGVQKKYAEAGQKANDVIDKATEAWEVNNATQPIAAHIKKRAREILSQVGVEEN